ncbi:acyl carrier protein [Dactylosporangium sp. CA-092794]|uniref:acyl carrier protein n=1 Tax=Dactylosporangium sp. CA-092794 TaxID=3239929 RepID=UPI003D91A21F
MTDQQLTDKIAAFVAERSDAEEEVTADTKFLDLGLDSLVLLELAAQLKRDYGIPVTDDDLYAAGTAAGAAALVAERRAVAPQV